MPLIRQKRKGNVTKSGAITIQPKAQLKEKDSLQGTIPVDLSINGHELTDTSIRFSDDIKNYVFGQSYPLTSISEGLPSSDSFYGSMVSSPNTVGTVFLKNSSISQKFLKDERQKESLAIEFKPYKEENQLLASSETEFFVSGTSPLISANFQQSVNSRERITIPVNGSNYTDLNDPSDTIVSTRYNHATSGNPFSIPNGSVYLNFFSYYNFSNKNWSKFKGYMNDLDDRISSNFNDLIATKNDIMQSLPNISLPFSPSAWARKDNVTNFVSGSLSAPISNFGFPFSKKFSPKEDNLLKMSNYIDKPFFLEKIIFRCNFSHKSEIVREANNNLQEFPLPYTQGINIFLLNNKKVNSKRNINHLADDTVLTKRFSNLTNSFENRDYCNDKDEENYREIITYGKVFVTTNAGISSSDPRYTTSLYNIARQADKLYLLNTSIVTNSKTGKQSLTLEKEDIEVDIEIPVRTDFKEEVISYIPVESVTYSADGSGAAIVGNPYGGKSLLDNDLNRSYIKNNDNYAVVKDTSSAGWDFTDDSNTNPVPSYFLDTISLRDEHSRNVPYILYPEDELILGISSFSNYFFENDFFSNTFIKPGASLILVGTPINNDRPKFEFDKRFLTSKSIRTGISGDKHFTDEFDTLPIQFYASSSIDKIVESTGNEKIDRAVTGYYSDGNRGTHLKAVELQNSDVSLTGSLLSEKMHFNYSSYGNLSDLYKQRPYTSYFNVGTNVVNHAVEKIFYDQDTGELTPQEDVLSFNSSSRSAVERPYKEE